MTALLNSPADAPAAQPRRGRGGRPRNPELGPRILEVVTELLAERGVGGFVMDDVAAHASVGKASIYRRWRSVDAILADAVAGLGPVVDWPAITVDTRRDLLALVEASVTGQRAAAQLAVLSVLPYRYELRNAYQVGPVARLQDAIRVGKERADARGDRWPRILQVHAAIALLHTDALTYGRQPDQVEIAAIVDALTGVTR